MFPNKKPAGVQSDSTAVKIKAYQPKKKAPAFIRRNRKTKTRTDVVAPVALK